MKFDLYARVSTDHQDVQQQMVYLRKWCIQNNHEIASETFDKESGTIPLRDRKQFKNLLDNPRGEALLVFNLDRLSRNWDDEPVFEKYFVHKNNYKLVSTKDEINLEDSNGRLMFRIKFAINCHMPEDMKEKQAIGIARAKSEGKFKGRKKGTKNKDKVSKEELSYAKEFIKLNKLKKNIEIINEIKFKFNKKIIPSEIAELRKEIKNE